MNKQRGIFCIEGQWNTNPRSKQSIRPILDILHHSCGVKYIYRKIHTKADFLETLRQYTFLRYKNYSILYIAFHGQPNGICIGDEFVTLAEISAVLEGCLTDCIVHFGSCSALRTKRLVIEDFLTKTRVSVISGYRKQVDFIESTAEELSFLYQITQSSKPLTKSKLADNFKMIVVN